ncbi:MAG: carboxylating nicotinate-nucleotide diphosphorylase [Dehalococcoidia bacterium]|nr:carboxylating nicotinate-nucleotide diphosphorylase [Dehalococcoidia bacterium]
MNPTQEQINRAIGIALDEDLRQGDITTDPLIPQDIAACARITAKANGVLAGIEVAEAVFHKVDDSLKFNVLMQDGTRMNTGDTIATIKGCAASILKAERTALNFLQRMSGIASETSLYVTEVGNLPTQILDTRKTVPGLRVLDKYAVAMGGGTNHRQHLGDAVLIKDNHLMLLRSQGISLRETITLSRERTPRNIKLEVEVETVKDAIEAAKAGADIVMLDNMSPDDMRRAVKDVNKRALLEASGGITLENVRAIAETGVDYISIGALTHSVKALDISLDMETAP